LEKRRSISRSASRWRDAIMALRNRRNSPQLASSAVEASEYLSWLGATVDVVKAMVSFPFAGRHPRRFRNSFSLLQCNITKLMYYESSWNTYDVCEYCIAPFTQLDANWSESSRHQSGRHWPRKAIPFLPRSFKENESSNCEGSFAFDHFVAQRGVCDAHHSFQIESAARIIPP
jgi:hypothetical protein